MARTRKAEAVSGEASGAGSKTQLLKYYRDMLLIRRFEERAGQLYGMGLIGGFCHLYIGQEAIAVGMDAIRKPGDQIITGQSGGEVARAETPAASPFNTGGAKTGGAKGGGGGGGRRGGF